MAHSEAMTPPVRPGLRERQRQETHRLIRGTAYDLAVERGVSALSVQAICEAAGVSSRTFFNHFRSKDEALVPDFPDFPAEAQQAFVDAVEPDLVAALQALMADHLACAEERDGVGEGPAAMQRLLQANPELLPRALAVFGALEQRVAGLVARRTGRETGDLFCVVAALTATSAMRAAFAALPEDGTDTAEALQRLVPEAFAVLRGLLTGSPPPAVRP
jgi:AcrR family transcriptional regulator